MAEANEPGEQVDALRAYLRDLAETFTSGELDLDGQLLYLAAEAERVRRLLATKPDEELRNLKEHWLVEACVSICRAKLSVESLNAVAEELSRRQS